MLQNIRMGLQSQKGALCRLFTTSAIINHGEYLVGSVVPAELKRVVELQARELWSEEEISSETLALERFALVRKSEEPDFCCIVAVKKDRKEEGFPTTATPWYGHLDVMLHDREQEYLQNVAPPLYGALNLMLNVDVGEALPLENVPEEWRADPKASDVAYINDIAVEPSALGRSVTTNMVAFAKFVAKSRGMRSLFMRTGANNKAVADLSMKAGFQVLLNDDKDIVMGQLLK